MKTKEEAIIKLYKFHNEYVDMVKAIAGNNMSVRNYAEDYVQEGYARLMKYDDLYDKVIVGEKVSKGYMFFVLRSIVINDVKKKSNLNYDYLSPTENMDEKFDMITGDRDPQRLAEEALEQRMFDVLDEAAADPEERIDWFDTRIFNTYVTTRKSYREISQESGIGDRTIYLSMKRCREYIAEHLYEEYKGFIERFGK